MKQRHELMVRQIKPSKRSVDARGPNTLGEKGIEPRGGRAQPGVSWKPEVIASGPGQLGLRVNFLPAAAEGAEAPLQPPLITP